MPNYNQTTGSATSWTRANRVMILNPFEANIPKQILFFEEKVVQVDSNTFKSDSGYVTTNFLSDQVIELRNPQTGEKTGETIAQSKVYQAIYSLYLDTAENRDIQIATQATQATQPIPPAP
jgi:hypothetical protein